MLTRRSAMAGLAGAAAVAAGPARAQSKGLVAVSMPTKIMARWIADGDNIVSVLKARGYDTDLQYGDDDVPNQVAQLENVITKGAKVLVIAAIDGSTLTDVLAKAANSGIKVIAYDRLIRNTPHVDYYATFENFQVGVEQGRSLVKGMSAHNGTGPKNVELFGGSPDDNNAFFFYNGAMSVLQPLIDGKQIAVPSGQVGMGKVATLRWDGAIAQSRMDNLLSAYYNDRRLDGVLAPNDGVSIGIISSVKGVGYGSADLPMPIITGQDCEVPSVKAIIRGDQYSSIYKDTRELAKVTADMVDAMLSGKPVSINDTTSYNNGAKVVPAYLLKPVIVTKENWRQELVDSGYYKASQFQ